MPRRARRGPREQEEEDGEDLQDSSGLQAALHSRKEQKRRLHIRSSCQSLCDLLPFVEGPLDTATTLELTARYIGYIKTHLPPDLLATVNRTVEQNMRGSWQKRENSSKKRKTSGLRKNTTQRSKPSAEKTPDNAALWRNVQPLISVLANHPNDQTAAPLLFADRPSPPPQPPPTGAVVTPILLDKSSVPRGQMLPLCQEQSFSSFSAPTSSSSSFSATSSSFSAPTFSSFSAPTSSSSSFSAPTSSSSSFAAPTFSSFSAPTSSSFQYVENNWMAPSPPAFSSPALPSPTFSGTSCPSTALNAMTSSTNASHRGVLPGPTDTALGGESAADHVVTLQIMDVAAPNVTDAGSGELATATATAVNLDAVWDHQDQTIVLIVLPPAISDVTTTQGHHLPQELSSAAALERENATVAAAGSATASGRWEASFDAPVQQSGVSGSPITTGAKGKVGPYWLDLLFDDSLCIPEAIFENNQTVEDHTNDQTLATL
ncbi:uncharacterized protein DDB_G0271670-like [Gadus chalcogrammus]|uniref:uncharacterized protein DDB_G0271670-like n=1 Tax=Gadus chalcogrammus TaxID=1042646 RepID=UPI0024C4D57B|nr:uncharacterized protein DDB_G0271670-like [Gadus chalcogrammus]